MRPRSSARRRAYALWPATVLLSGCIALPDRDLAITDAGDASGVARSDRGVDPALDTPGADVLPSTDARRPDAITSDVAPSPADAALHPDGAGGAFVPSDAAVGGTPADLGPACEVDACPAAPLRAARITSIDLPVDRAGAEMAGCQLLGASNGSAFSGLITVAGGTWADYYQPDESSNIRIVTLAEAGGWSVGQPVAEARRIGLSFYTGLPSNGENPFQIDPDRPFAGGRFMEPLDVTVAADGTLTTATPGPVAWTLPVLPGLPVAVPLEAAVIRGRVAVDGSGFRLHDGVLAGYLTRDALIGVLQALHILCAPEDAPEFCTTYNFWVPPASCQPSQDGTGCADGLTLMAAYFQLGENDALVTANAPVSGCAPGECNARAVCARFEMQGVTIADPAVP